MGGMGKFDFYLLVFAGLTRYFICRLGVGKCSVGMVSFGFFRVEESVGVPSELGIEGFVRNNSCGPSR